MIYSEFFLLTTIFFIFLINIFIKRKKQFIIFSISIFNLIICFLLTLYNTYYKNIGYMFYNMFIFDDISNLLKLFSYLITIIIFIYSYKKIKKKNLILKTKFYIFTLFSLLGQIILISSNNLLSIYLCLELISISLYSLLTLNYNNYKFNDSAIKYFILNILSSGFFLYGVSIIYGITNTLNINNIFNNIIIYTYNTDYITILALIFIISSLLFKLGISPFHIWLSDIYKKSSILVLIIINYIPKLSIFILIFKIFFISFFIFYIKIKYILIFISLLSILIGSIGSITQNNLKRLLAYSSIFNMGCIFLNLSSINNNNIYNYINIYSISLYYIMIYIFTTLGIFGIILNISKNYIKKYKISNLKNLNKNYPILTFIIFLFFLSFSGIPPFIGFYLKLIILKNLLQVNFIFLSIFFVLFSIISIIYILKIIKFLYFFKSFKINKKIENINFINFIIIINILIILYISIFPNKLIIFLNKMILNSFSFILLNNI